MSWKTYSRLDLPNELVLFKLYVNDFASGYVRSVAKLATLSLYLVSIQTPLTTHFQKTWLATNLVTFSGVIGDFWRLTWMHVSFLLFSTSSGCCWGPHPHPKALTGGTVLTQQSLPAAVRAGGVHPSETRLQINRTKLSDVKKKELANLPHWIRTISSMIHYK